MELKNITYTIENDFAFVGFGKFDEKSMTTFSREALAELGEVVDMISKNGNLKGVFFHSHKEGCFLAGMDITVIDSLRSENEAMLGCSAGQELFNMIEDLTIPTVALVDGICLGGGLELALSCKFIIATDSPKTKIGLPEVMLGVLPGFGGTYRLPLRLQLPDALDLLLSGKQVDAKKAKKIGLVDFVVPKEKLYSLATVLLPTLLKQAEEKQGTVQAYIMKTFVARKFIFQKARENVLKLTKGFYPAPLKILEHVEKNYGKERATYLQSEASIFAELSQTSQSKNLRNVFFLTDNAKKLYPKANDNFKAVKVGAAVGAGTMGGGIAWLFAKNNQSPYLKDLNQAALELGLKQSSKNFQSELKKRKITNDDFERLQRSIIPTLSYNGFKKVDLVVEAVVENMNIKKSVFADIEKNVTADCLLTSNSSSLSINEMAQALSDSSRFAGLHFFNPVHKMPLVEIIKHQNVSEKTITSLYQWALKVKKTPIVVNDGPGFLVNRILMPFINEAAYLLEEGVSIKKLDDAVLNFGMPMGPCRLMDEIGIDVLVKVGHIMQEGLGKRATPSSLSEKATALGFLGKKSGKGFYIYDSVESGQTINQEILKTLPSVNKEMDEREIQMRVILPMINEAANILADGITDKAQTIDIGMIYGTGFPPFRGGLLKYADNEGLEKIVHSLENYANTVSADRYTPSPFLKELATNKKKFYDL